MTAQTPNKATVPVGGDGWNPVAHIRGAIETSHIIVPVADEAERDGLAAKFPGGVLPLWTWVSRTDRDGDLEGWNGATWRPATETAPLNTADPLWTFTGQLSRVSSTAGKRTVTISERMVRVGPGVTMTTAYKTFIAGFVPATWRPAAMFNGWALLTGADDGALAQLWWRITPAGDLQARLSDGATTIDSTHRFHLYGNWTTS